MKSLLKSSLIVISLISLVGCGAKQETTTQPAETNKVVENQQAVIEAKLDAMTVNDLTECMSTFAGSTDAVERMAFTGCATEFSDRQSEALGL